MCEKRLALKFVEVKIKRNWNPGRKEGLKNQEIKSGNTNIIEHHQRGEIRRKEKYEEFERKYITLKEKGMRTVIEELKQ